MRDDDNAASVDACPSPRERVIRAALARRRRKRVVVSYA
jgi:hypothetical protein